MSWVEFYISWYVFGLGLKTAVSFGYGSNIEILFSVRNLFPEEKEEDYTGFKRKKTSMNLSMQCFYLQLNISLENLKTTHGKKKMTC